MDRTMIHIDSYVIKSFYHPFGIRELLQCVSPARSPGKCVVRNSEFTVMEQS